MRHETDPTIGESAIAPIIRPTHLFTSRLPPGITYSKGRKNPDHGNLPKYVSQINGLKPHQQTMIKQAIRRLRQRREDADYRPGMSVASREAKESLRNLEIVRNLLGR